jgi:hypothetical protein
MKKPENGDYPTLLGLLEEIAKHFSEYQTSERDVKEALSLLDDRVSNLEAKRKV